MRDRYKILLVIASVLLFLRGLFSFVNTTNEGWLTPTIYRHGDPVEIIVNKIESDATQLPYGYYDLPFTCPPTVDKKPLHLSLNEVIRGDRKWQSNYELEFGKDTECTVLCARKTNPDGMRSLDKFIKQEYVVQWFIDKELPAATTFISTVDQKKYYGSGFPLGFVDEETGKVYVNNHVMMVIRYHAIDDYNFTIVGFEIYPKSVSDYHCPGASKDYDQYEVVVPEIANEDTFIPFTYSVYWREEFDVEWKDRYNLFFDSGELSGSVSRKFHWISLANSASIAFLMTFIVSLIFIKITGIPNRLETKKESPKASIFVIARNWFYDDRPVMPHLFICIVSMGVHFLFTVIGSLTISCSLNSLHTIRNSVLTMALLFFVLGAFMASFVGGTLLIENNKLIMRRGSLKNVFSNILLFSVVCGSLLPGMVILTAIILNCIIWLHTSTNVLPFATIMKLLFIYFIVCIPLSVLGGSIAANKDSEEYSRLRSDSIKRISRTRANKIMDEDQGTDVRTTRKLKYKVRWQLKKMMLDTVTVVSLLASGIFPFIMIYVELQFVYKSVWYEKTTFYYYYGFLLANIILLCLVICDIAIICSYLMMTVSSKDNSDSWKWKTFQLSSSCAWYMEAYSIYYVFKVLNMRDFSSILISVCYSLLFNALCGLAMGSIGYLASLWFVKRVYRSHFQK
ncbi:Tmn3p KNAG_0C03430 [Huiozyma naganishii CBS 8797]|uniref:Transmembrane 9 superfamily member n=1 Tax=Huiozyma naganishii (strain ATCC MYA-139 / BCRC 22969 / CBS 8797 / KCTC 17520 / NBRC 10181 / NCYC 3082 / Yp74L-3) TaxID=1071383 RepID=J7R3P5_HUIN7|nr:hypothetical protein KNAG_0C03430 [Kazachstania naganishii CBS 8797]CCK69450.1 hypothetical protein KNAG_0C03430 [Kazachstania naganishii CBS 8797]